LKIKNISLVAGITVLVFLSGVPLLSGGSITNYANAKYATNTQSQGNSNECTTGTNCAITSPQTHGDGTANSPVNTQISEFNEEQEEVGESPGVGFVVTLTVENCGLIVPPVQDFVRCDVGSPFESIDCNVEEALPITCFLFFQSGGGTTIRCDDRPMPVPETQTLQCRVFEPNS
jgi:hypothetical protein